MICPSRTCLSSQAKEFDLGRCGYRRVSAEVENGAAGDQRGSNQDQTEPEQASARVHGGV